MLRELMSLFRSEDALAEMGNEFARMLEITHAMVVGAGKSYFGDSSDAAGRTELYKSDIEVNQLERSIRKRVVAHLSLPGNQPDVPYGLLLMSLVKDVERIGDYAKNLAEVWDIHPEALPDDPIVSELKEVCSTVESVFASSSRVFNENDHETANQLIVQGRSTTKRCDSLLHMIARSSFDPPTTTALVLGARYYKRIGGHVLNVLTSVVMPLHKLDYYDEEDAVRVRESDKSAI